MLSTMRAVVLRQPNLIRCEEVARPEPKPGEVLIKVTRCGICGSDAHIFRGDFPVPNLPLIIGHEFAGTVAAVGPGVRSIKPGAKATADINIGCGTCWFCRHNQKLFCADMRQIGVHQAGGMAEYVVAPATNIYALPAAMPFEHAAFIEPLACAVRGQQRIEVDLGETVLIIGAGPMGVAHAALSRLRGAGRIIVFEPSGTRRARAHANGSDVELDPLAGGADDFVRDATGGRGPDVVIEAVGRPQTYLKAIQLVRRGGRVLAFGAAPPQTTIELKPFDLNVKELTIVGSYAGTNETWPMAIDLIASGRVNPSLIVDSVRSLADAPRSIESMETDKSFVKIQIDLAAHLNQI
jgi:2-desacetyl-2-hydroxyethyl bacteriochlorophyllide A dehydrogenase